MKKDIPTFNSDEEIQNFLQQDLSAYIESGSFKPASFEFLPKDEKINLRLSSKLLEVIKERAEAQHMPYQKYMRLILERESLQ